MKIMVTLEIGPAERMAIAAEHDGVIAPSNRREATRAEVRDFICEAAQAAFKRSLEEWDIARFGEQEQHP